MATDWDSIGKVVEEDDWDSIGKPVDEDWDSIGKVVEPVELDAVDTAGAAAATFMEGALGIGDELAAFGSELGSTVYDIFNTDKSIGESLKSFSIDRGLDLQRAKMDAFDAENPNASLALTVAGVGTSMLIPAASSLKLAQTGTRLQRLGKIAAAGALEGSAYGYLSGRDEGRAEGAVLGGLIGGVAAGGLSLLLRNTDEITRMTQEDAVVRKGSGSFIGGDEGFVNTTYAGAKRTSGRTTDTSTMDRTVKKVVAEGKQELNEASDLVQQSGLGKTFRSIAYDTKAWLEYNVGTRAARLAEDAEWMAKSGTAKYARDIEQRLAGFDSVMEANPNVFAAIQNLGRGKQGTQWKDVYKAAKGDRALLQEVLNFKKTLDEVKLLDISKVDNDWVHTMFKPNKKVGQGGVAQATDYVGPAKALEEYMADVVSANALAERFGVTLSKDVPKNGSRINTVIEAIGEAAKKQGATDDVANNLMDGLKSQFIASKEGGAAVGGMLRKLVSTAYLGNMSNAILNMSEWVTPAYQNGLKNTVKPFARGLKTFIQETANGWTYLGKYGDDAARARETARALSDPNWISIEKMGLGDNWMGEVAATAADELKKDLSGFQYIMARTGQVVDNVGKEIFHKTGVKASNKAGQEAQMNSAIGRAKQLIAKADKGDDAALAALRKHDGMRGLSESEILETMDALRKGNMDSPWVMNFAGAALNKWQPVSGSALPKAFADNPNGRMWYSMLTYMNKQANGFRRDVGLNLVDMYKYGINSPKGKDAFKEFTKASAKYTAYYGMLAGTWERLRASMDPTRDIAAADVLSPEGITEATIAQMASNLSSGVFDPRAEQHGGQYFMNAPVPAEWATNVGSGIYRGGKGMLTGNQTDMDAFYRMLQSDVPGLSSIDKTKRMLTGERLFIEPED